MFGSIGTLVGDLNTFQTGDLGTVNKSIQSVSQPSRTPEWEYWAGQITVGLLPFGSGLGQSSMHYGQSQIRQFAEAWDSLHDLIAE